MGGEQQGAARGVGVRVGDQHGVRGGRVDALGPGPRRERRGVATPADEVGDKVGADALLGLGSSALEQQDEGADDRRAFHGPPVGVVEHPDPTEDEDVRAGSGVP